MGYQLDIYGLDWAKLEAKWREASAGQTAGPGRLDDSAVEKFIAMIQGCGTLLASLDHASASAEDFLDRFLGETVPKAFGGAVMREQLIERPLCGNRPEVLPAWGGLTLAEVEEAIREFRPPGPVGEDDDDGDDQASWLRDLHMALEEAKKQRCDVVTVYG